MASIPRLVPLCPCLFACLLLAPAVCTAAEPVPTLDDLLLGVQARKLLMEDELLRPLNLGVSVRRREIELWGAVPSEELSLRAEIKLRTMLDALKVRNQLFIQPMPIVPKAQGQPNDMPEYLARFAAAAFPRAGHPSAAASLQRARPAFSIYHSSLISRILVTPGKTAKSNASLPH